VAKVLVDIGPLKQSRDFRLLFSGQLVSFMGSQLTVVAVAIQVYEMTHSSLDVGLVSLAQLPPLLIGSLAGGAVVDSRDRRRLMMVVQVLLAALSAGLAVNATRPHPVIWPLFVLTALAAGLSGIDRPARSAVVPNVVEKAQLPAAFALWQIQMQLGLVIGPAIAGLLIATFHGHLAPVFWIDTATFAVALLAVSRMRPLPPAGGGTRVSVASIAEGLRYLKGRQVLQGTFLIDINAMVFGMPRALFPAIGTTVFHGGAQTVGLLFAAPGAGALIGAVTTGWVGNVKRHGMAVVIAVMLWGLSIGGFGLTTWLPLALLLLALAGAADVVSAVFRNTMLQTSVPDSLRGRLSGVHIGVVTGGPRLGDVEAGAVASLTNARVSVVSGGLACVIGAVVVARLLPDFTKYSSDRAGGDASPAATTLDVAEEREIEGV
jgi:MFS family permease